MSHGRNIFMAQNLLLAMAVKDSNRSKALLLHDEEGIGDIFNKLVVSETNDD